MESNNSVVRLNFPIETKHTNIKNDSIDVNIILPDESVYYVMLITPNFLQSIIEESLKSTGHYIADDVLVIDNLEMRNILQSISEIIATDDWVDYFTRIGSVDEVFGTPPSFGEIVPLLITK